MAMSHRPSRSPRRRAACGVWLLLAGALAAPTRAQEQPVAQALLAAHVPAVDAPDQLAAQLLTAAAAAGGSPAAALLLAETRRLVPTLQEPQRCLERLDQLPSDRMHGLTAQAARATRASLMVRLGRRREALTGTDPYADQASVMLAIGPFGDAGDHYTGVLFEPELAFPERGRRCRGRFGDVEARAVERTPLERAIDLAVPDARKPGCFYGLHQVHAETDLSCWAEVVHAGSLELFVNGESRLLLNRAATRVGTVSHVPIVLGTGVNHVLVKTTSSRHSEMALRYVDGAGRTVSGLTELDASTVRAHRAPVVAPQTAPGFVDAIGALLRAARREEDAAARTEMLLAATLSALRTGDFDRGLASLHQLEQAPPREGVAAVAMARAYELALPLPDELRLGRARELIEQVAPTLPDHAHVARTRARMMQELGRREEALRLLQARVPAGTAGPQTYADLVRALRSLRFAAAARRALIEWRERWPGDARPWLTEVRDRATAGDARGALQLALEGLKAVPHDALLSRAAELAANLGDEQALPLSARRHEVDPDGLPALRDRERLLAALGRRDEALDQLEQIANHEAANPTSRRAAGERLLGAGRRDAALTALQRSLDEDPSQHDLRRLLHRLRGEPVDAELEPFRRDGAEIARAFEASDRERQGSSSLVLDQMIVRFYADGSRVEETHQLRRINDLRGVEAHQEAAAAARADELVLLRTIAADGSMFVPSRVARSFAMPRLEPGVFIEEIYRNYHGAPAPGPWRGPQFYFRSTDEPFLLTELVLVLPPEAQGRIIARGFPAPVETIPLEDGLVGHVYRLTDVPRLPMEPNAPPVPDLVPIVTYGEDTNTDAIARESWARALRHSVVSPQVAEATAALLASVDGDAARLRRIYEFTHETIADGGGSPDATATLMQQRGPRIFLTASMLRAAGVPFRHAICAPNPPELNDLGAPLFLGDDAYDTPALVVQPRDGDDVWLFASTPRWYPLGAIPSARAGAAALLLDEGLAEPSEVPQIDLAEELGIAVRGTLRVTDDGGGELDAECRIRGVAGYAIAQRLRTAEEDLRGVIARRIAGQIFSGWSLREVRWLDLDDPGAVLGFGASLRRQRVLSAAGDRVLLELPLNRGELLARLGDQGQRNLPLHLARLDASTWEIAVEPGVHRIVAVPAPVRLEHPLLRFSLRFARDAGRVVVRRDFVQRAGQLPASQFAEWISLLRRIDAAEASDLELLPPG